MGDANDATEHEVTGHDPQQAFAGEDFMGLLAEHVPLALIADLAARSGPHSAEILESEGLPDNAWWETPGDAQTPPSADDPEPVTGDGGEETISA